MSLETLQVVVCCWLPTIFRPAALWCGVVPGTGDDDPNGHADGFAGAEAQSI